MKNRTFLTMAAFLFAAGIAIQGCSKEVGNDVQEAGSDMKREVKKAANTVKDQVQDVTENINR
jgi:gas vesicle protein